MEMSRIKHQTSKTTGEKTSAQKAKATGKLSYYQRKIASMTEEERQAHRAKETAARRLSRQRQIASMSAQERRAHRAKAAAASRRYYHRKMNSMSAQERRAHAAARSLYDRRKVESMSAQEKQEKNAKASTARNLTCQHKIATPAAGDYDIPVARTLPIKQARKYDQERIMHVTGKPNEYRAAVCVLCDRLIIGCESIHKITAESLRSQEKKTRISVKSYEDYHQVNLKDELISQYQISGHDLEGLLLSPRAKETTTRDGRVAFEACSSCYNAWQTEFDSPPKHAISNGFAIGHIPEHIIKDEDITEQMSALVARVRPFAYLFAYTAGAHKAIRGHFSFFEVDLDHTGSVMNHFLSTGANPLVYVVLCGRMTPTQKEIVRNKALADTKELMKLLEWFINESGHQAYEGVTPPTECPQPSFIIDEETTNNTDQEQDPEREREYAGASFHFSSAHEPQDDTGVYGSSQQFVKAMIDRTMPTLLVSGGKYADMRELQLEDVCPVQFPWGQGGPKAKRRAHISVEECYRHYCRLSLKPFMRGDFLLILNHMYNRQRSFQTAVVTCISSAFGQSLAERMSTLTMKDLDRAMFQNDTRQKVTGTAGDYIRTVEASCKPIGYTALSARQNRRMHFAMDNYFGGHAIFLTTTPCDERTIRVKVFANAGNNVSLPKLGDWDDASHLRDCRMEFDLRKNTRSLYPGACSLVYQHLMQIITECLIGWDPKKQSGSQGVFGVPIAYSRTDEEQGRKTLHAHWQIWVELFNTTRSALFHSDESKRRAARDALISYIDQVVCASYGTNFVVTHNCGAGKELDCPPVTMPMHQILQEVEDKNVIRKAAHQDHCLDVKGKLLECKQCRESFSPSECITMGVNHLRRKQIPTPTARERDDNVTNGNIDIGNATEDSTVIRKEWLDPAVIRYPFDFDEEGRPTEALEQQPILMEAQGDGSNKQTNHQWLLDENIRRDILHYVYDEHEYTHRGTCFKNGKVECRGHLPEMASDQSIIFDNDAINAMKQEDRFRVEVGQQRHRNQDTSNSNENKGIIFRHRLNGEVEQQSQYAILPRRTNGSQFLNQHNLSVSKVLGCNTNVTLGDPSHTFYTTLYKSKDTQAEDKMAFHRVHASLGRRLWRTQQRQMQQHEEEKQNQTGVETGDATPAAVPEGGNVPNGNNDNDDKKHACFIEGLGRVMTGVNALLSRDVVSSTMAHLLICQRGERFTYSHEFSHILLRNMENVLEEKDGMSFRLRRNWNADTKETVSWADCSAYDYIHRPVEVSNLCLYEYTMWYKKEYKTFEQLNSKKSTTKAFKFANGHQGRKFCHLTKRAHPVIPIINMVTDLCDVKSLDVLDNEPIDSGKQQRRERYAKTAMMLFFPFSRAEDLTEDDSYWQKFVAVGGTEEYDGEIDDTVGLNPSSPQFWNRGRMILENIETRRCAEKEMQRPKRKITYLTDTPKSTGKRKREDVDKDDGYDIDIGDFFNNMNDEGLQQYMSEPQALADSDLRSHSKIMKRADVRESSAIKTHFDRNTSVLATSKSTEKSSKSSKDAHNPQQQPTTSCNSNAPLRYNDILTFIQGSLLVGSNNNDEGAVAGDEAGGEADDEAESGSPRQRQSCPNKIPTLHEIAKGKSSKYNLDDKQYIAYQIVCCTFLLQLVTEGDQRGTKLGDMLGATLGHLEENVQRTKDNLVRELKAKGGKEQLIMFITGPAGCGKSTTMEAAQLYCHRFCSAIAAAFNDNTFYFTATTGSAAALFGGTTIHSAAHLNKSRINDGMRAVWKDVRILVIDEISFFKAGDVIKLDRQLKKLTGRYDAVYGGVSVVFSGDFHQLKPICAEDEVLYSESDAATIWENTINCAIFLDNSHRFKDDPEFGAILARLRMGEDTREDRELINKRVVGSTLPMPEDAPDACVACSTNKERNGVTAATFKKHIEEIHPSIDDDRPPPNHTLIIEAAITIAHETETEDEKRKRKRKRTQHRKPPAAFHDTVVTQLGDDDIRSTDFAANGAKIEPALRVYPGSHHMCITNEDLDQGRGNGTLCKFLKVKLTKDGQERRWKNWDGKKVWTVSVDDVEWMEFEHYPTPTGKKARTFRLTPQEFTATIKFPLSESCDMKIGNAKVKQIPVNSNIATTGHKLQGMSKDVLVVNDWNYRCANWVYVVLSRVRTKAGLYLMKALDVERRFNVPQSLIRFEQRLKDTKEKPILDMLGYKSDN